MKQFFKVFFFLLCTFEQMYSQEVVFQKFELVPFSKLISSDGWNLRYNLKNTSGKTINYVYVSYLAVNKVNDAESDKLRHVKKFIVQSVGPYLPGETKKLVVECAVWHVNRQTAYPYQIDIKYSDGTEQEIQITNDNINKYFPSITPRVINDLKNVLTTEEKTEKKKDIKQKFPENESGELEFSEVVKCDMSKDTLFINAKNWAVNTFYDYKEVLQYEDKEAGKLIVKGLYKPKQIKNILNKESETFRFTVIFDIKDNMYRYKVGNFICNTTSVINDKVVSEEITPKDREEKSIKLLQENKPNSISLANAQIDFYNEEYECIIKMIEGMKNKIIIKDDF